MLSAILIFTVRDRVLLNIKKYNKIWIIFLTGLVLKISVMPFALHADLLSMSWRANLMATHGLWGLTTNQHLSHLIYAGMLKVMGVFGFDFSHFFPTNFGLSPTSSTASVGDWLTFVQHPQLNTFLFAIKIPHLIADTTVFILLLRLTQKYVKNITHRLVVLGSWWLNPITFYAFYIFARHDSLTSLAMLITIMYVSQAKVANALLSFFIAFQVRFQPLLYTPLVLLGLYSKKLKPANIIKQLALVTIAVGLFIGVQSALPFDTAQNGQIRGNAPSLDVPTTVAPKQAKPLLSRLGIPKSHSKQIKPVFLATYMVLIALFGWLQLTKPVAKGRALLKRTALFFAMTLTLYFTINSFYPHYFVWLCLPAILSLIFIPRLWKPYLAATLCFFTMGITATDHFAITQNLFLPISPLLFRTPTLAQLISARGLDLALIHMVARVLLSCSLLWATGLMLLEVLQLRAASGKKLIRTPTAVLLAFILWTDASSQAQALTVPLQANPATTTYELQLLAPGEVFQQSFSLPRDTTFGSLEIRLYTGRYNNQDERLELTLALQESGEILYKNTYATKDFYNKANYPFGFTPVTSSSKNMLIKLRRDPAADPEIPLGIYTSDTNLLDFQILTDDSERFAQILKADIAQKVGQQLLFFKLYAFLVFGTILDIIFVLLVSKK